MERQCKAFANRAATHRIETAKAQPSRPPARPPARRTNKRAAAGLQKVPLAKAHFQIMKTSQCQAGCNEPDRSGTSRSRRASGQKGMSLQLIGRWLPRLSSCTAAQRHHPGRASVKCKRTASHDVLLIRVEAKEADSDSRSSRNHSGSSTNKQKQNEVE